MPEERIKTFSPRPFRLETLLLYWFMSFFLPLITVSALLRYSSHEHTEHEKSLKTTELINTAAQFRRNTIPENYFQKQISSVETAAGLPQRNSKLLPAEDISYETIIHELKNQLKSLTDFSAMLIIIAGENLAQPYIYHNPDDFAGLTKPSNRAANAILTEAIAVARGPASRAGNNNQASERLTRNLIDSTFGGYFSSTSIEEDFTTGFTARFGGRKVFSARRMVFDRHGRHLFSYIGLFCEKHNLLKPSFQAAVKELSPEFTCKISLKQQHPFIFLSQPSDNQIAFSTPVPYSLLLSGIHTGQSISESLLKQGIMHRKQALYPHFIISSSPASDKSRRAADRTAMSMLIASCLSLLLLKSFHQNGNFKLSIKNRLFASVFLGTALPALIFLLFAHQHGNELLSLRILKLKNLMKNRFTMLELSLKTQDETIADGLNKMVDELRRHISSQPEMLYQILDSQLHESFFGASLFKNDGNVIEKVDFNKLKAAIHRSKFSLNKDIMHGSMIRLMQELNLMKPEFLATLQSTPAGRKSLAVAGIFETMDVDNFCSYEGDSQTAKQDFGTFRFLNYKLLPEKNSPEADAGFLLIAQDLREATDFLLKESFSNLNIFRFFSPEGLIETTLIGTYDLHAQKINLSRIWPAGTVPGNRALKAVNEVSQGKSEVVFESAENRHTPVITMAKRIGRYPLIAVSECQAWKISQARENLRWLLFATSGYLILLMLFLSLILNELFAMPIKTLEKAAQIIGAGHQIIIANEHNNELSVLTDEFGRMSRQIVERERLARFISRDAIYAISQESLTMKASSSQKVKRTIMFIHIRNFSQLSAILTPEKTVEFLNEYFTFFESHITNFSGSIDKFISDGIMAVFTDEDGMNGAAAACQTALAARQGQENLNQILKQLQLPEISFCAGIATGIVIAGRIGASEGRLDHTVIGDRVNLAARLETMAQKLERSSVLIDQETKDMVKDLINTEKHGELTIKGKSEPVTTYELI